MVEGKSRIETIEKAIDQEKRDLVSELGYNPADVVTVGNHSFIELSENRVYKILKILDSFEKNNPDLEITNWRPGESEISKKNYCNEGYWKPVPCLFIDHKKKI